MDMEWKVQWIASNCALAGYMLWIDSQIDPSIRSRALVGEAESKLNACWISKYTLFQSKCVACRSYAARLGRSRPNS